MIRMAACPDPLLLVLLGSDTQLLKSLVSKMRGCEADLRHRLTFLPLATLLRYRFVAQEVENASEGIVAKDETTNSNEKRLGKHF